VKLDPRDVATGFVFGILGLLIVTALAWWTAGAIYSMYWR
jgi:hypothetical protein